MARGRPRKPTRILKLNNSWRAKTRPDEPEPTVKAPSCPKWLGPYAKVEWRRLVKHLLRLQMLTEIDRTVLASHCQALQDFVDAKKVIDTEGAYYQTEGGGLRAHPAVRVREEAAGRMLRTAVELGISPASRSKVKVPKKGPGSAPVKDPADRFKGKAG